MSLDQIHMWSRDNLSQDREICFAADFVGQRSALGWSCCSKMKGYERFVLKIQTTTRSESRGSGGKALFIELLDALGRTIESRSVIAKKNRFSTSAYNSGAYSVRIIFVDRVIYRKIIIN